MPYPDCTLLEALHTELAKLEQGVKDARVQARQAQHGAAEETAAVEARVAARADQDARVVAACEKIAGELDGAEVQAVQQGAAFAVLHALLPVPQGVLKTAAALAKFVTAQRTRHTESAVRQAVLKAVRAEQEAELDTTVLIRPTMYVTGAIHIRCGE